MTTFVSGLLSLGCAIAFPVTLVLYFIWTHTRDQPSETASSFATIGLVLSLLGAVGWFFMMLWWS